MCVAEDSWPRLKPCCEEWGQPGAEWIVIWTWFRSKHLNSWSLSHDNSEKYWRLQMTLNKKKKKIFTSWSQSSSPDPSLSWHNYHIMHRRDQVFGSNILKLYYNANIAIVFSLLSQSWTQKLYTVIFYKWQLSPL